MFAIGNNDNVDIEAMETSTGIDSLDDDTPSDHLAKCKTENGFATCRKALNSWVVEVFFDGNNSASYMLSTAVDKYSQHNRKVVYEVDPFSEDTSFAHHMKPVISCILSSSNKLRSHEVNVVLDDVFSSVFGGEATLVDSDVIVIGLPDGRVVWWPCKKTPSSNHDLHLLCHLEQPVVGILLGCLESKDNLSDCVIFVGQYGKLITVTTGNQLLPVFNVDFISGPVTSCCMWKNYLYHTVASGELWQTQLLRRENPDVDDFSLQGRTLPVASCSSVSVETSDELGNEKVLRYLSKDGELRRFEFRAIDDLCAGRDKVGSHHEQQISSFVNALHDATSKLQSVQKRIQLQKRCLANLTTALWLIHGANTSTNLEITCFVRAVEGEVNTYLFDVLVNGLSLDLSATWHVVCSISEENLSDPVIYNKSMPVETASHSIRLQLKHQVSLTARHDTICPPLLLECGLHLEQEIPLSGELNRLYIPLKTFHLDVVWFLQSHLVWHPKEQTVEDHLWTLAEKRGYARPESKCADTCHKEHKFLVTVSSSSVSRALKTAVEGELLLELLLLVLLDPLKDISSPMFCFGHKVEINTERDGEVFKIYLKSSNLVCAVQLHSVISKRIKALLQSSGVNALESVEVSKELLTFINQLFSQLKQYDDDNKLTNKKMLDVYDRLRNGFTCNLPLV